MTRLSVIIPTHNRRELVRQAIESVLTQEPSGFSIELIVVDDRSEDDAKSVIAEYPTVRYVRAEAGNAAGARNAGIAVASGQWLAFLDDDDVWLPHKLRRITAALEQHPEARVIMSAAYSCSADLTPGPIWHAPKTDQLGDYRGFLESVVTPSVVLIQKSVLDQVGPFDELPYRAEDRELYLRIARAGFSFLNVDEPLIYYRRPHRINGDMTLKTFRATLDLLRREFRHEHAAQPTFLERRALELNLRRWYTKALLEASGEQQLDGNERESRRLDVLAFGVSPLHWFYHRVVRRKNSRAGAPNARK